MHKVSVVKCNSYNNKEEKCIKCLCCIEVCPYGGLKENKIIALLKKLKTKIEK